MQPPLCAVSGDQYCHVIKEQLVWHLKDIEKRMISKGKVDYNLMDKPLVQFKIGFKNSKKERSLNNLEEFWKNS